jgi:hypothetical protein
MKQKIYIIAFIILSTSVLAQNKFDFKGQISGITSFSPNNDLDWFAGGRFIPEASYTISLDSIHNLDFNVAANIWGSVLFHPFDTSKSEGDIESYRIWARYTGKQYEVRLGLQKIDFGVATLLRPLQWFNQIDPRDPLQLTNGVYGALGRYYFSNNANIWLWSLIGNEKTRGFEVIETNNNIPEFGARFQYPVPKGEIGFSYHHRNANSTNILGIQQYDDIEENRFGIDCKWDVTVGLWFEATHTIKNKDLGDFTNQSLLNVGTDYTFGLGNGLNVVAEHLISSFDTDTFKFKNTDNTSAISAMYPLSFFDNISTMYYYNWDSKDSTFFLNYEHQFSKLSGYAMVYYNPEVQQGIQNNELTTNFSGPGIRFMLVYNY